MLHHQSASGHALDSVEHHLLRFEESFSLKSLGKGTLWTRGASRYCGFSLNVFSASEVLDNHKSVLTSFGVQSNSEELGLPYIYWIPKMHKNPYKHRFIAGSSKCSTKPLSIILTKLLTHIKQGLQKYCETAYSRSGVNQMWILKNSKELLDHLKSPNFNLITNIKSFDFSTLYTTIPHQKLKTRLATIIRNSFLHKNGNRRYKFLVLGREGTYFVKEHFDAKNKYTEEDIIKMLELTTFLWSSRERFSNR